MFPAPGWCQQQSIHNVNTQLQVLHSFCSQTWRKAFIVVASPLSIQVPTAPNRPVRISSQGLCGRVGYASQVSSKLVSPAWIKRPTVQLLPRLYQLLSCYQLLSYWSCYTKLLTRETCDQQWATTAFPKIGVAMTSRPHHPFQSCVTISVLWWTCLPPVTIPSCDHFHGWGTPQLFRGTATLHGHGFLPLKETHHGELRNCTVDEAVGPQYSDTPIRHGMVTPRGCRICLPLPHQCLSA